MYHFGAALFTWEIVTEKLAVQKVVKEATNTLFVKKTLTPHKAKYRMVPILGGGKKSWPAKYGA